MVKLAKLPGKRDARYAHLFCDTDYEHYAETGSAADNQALHDKVAELHANIAKLQARIAELEG